MNEIQIQCLIAAAESKSFHTAAEKLYMTPPTFGRYISSLEDELGHSRLFCTRWNGLDKSGGMLDALDSAEHSGSLIILLNEGVGFVKRNMKTRWKKTANSRIEMPDYCERRNIWIS